MVTTAALAAFLALQSAGDGAVPDLDTVRQLVKPRVSETKWEEIPWEIDLWEARRKAAALGKPIMLWEMDGNPMGCG
ncbi:MAG TPA: hypothetical protein VEJ18_22500 [Planctomycetota bacterium]|nr:hypothetical protein [Planctomycetota bacterium]